MYIVFLGPPGAGKGTQAAIIAERTGLKHIATGELFREAVRAGTDLGRLAKSYMDKGNLVPDQVTIQMLFERISRPDAAAGVLFDGFPRNLAQAQALDDTLFSAGKEVDRAVLIAVSDKELVARLSGRWLCPNGHIFHAGSNSPKVAGVCDVCGTSLYQREDDAAETVLHRIETQKPPQDLIEHYSRQGKLDSINGEQSFEQVTRDIMRTLITVSPTGGRPT